MLNCKQAVIFAGGLGTRMSEVTAKIPKPTVPVGGAPILFHLIEIFYNQGIRDILILGGYKFPYLKALFENGYKMPTSNAFIANGQYINELENLHDDLNIKLIYTGERSETGTRLLKAEKYLQDFFFLTYGDGLADVNLEDVEKQFNSGNYEACVSVVNPRSRYGEFFFNESGQVSSFVEKPILSQSLVNAGFSLLSKKTLKYINQSGNHSFESTILKSSAEEGRLTVHHHKGYFRSIDTLRDIEDVNKEFDLWDGKTPW